MNDETSPDAPSPSKSKGSKANENVAPPPASAQVLINLRTWAPFLQNPTQRASHLKYAAREKRDSGTWRINLPVMCWKCQTTEGLKSRKVVWTIRSFESAIPIAVAGGTFTAIQFILAAVLLVKGSMSWATILAGTASLTFLLAFGMLFLKSWTEEVRLSLQTCPKCEYEFRGPEVATDQEELHLFLPSPELAAAALAEQKAERRSKKGGGPAEPAHGDDDEKPKKKSKPAAPAATTKPVAPAKPTAAKRPAELPPIQLDDEPKEVKEAPVKVVKPAPRKPPEDLPPIKLDD